MRSNTFRVECNGYCPNNPAYDTMFTDTDKAKTPSPPDLRDTRQWGPDSPRRATDRHACPRFCPLAAGWRPPPPAARLWPSPLGVLHAPLPVGTRVNARHRDANSPLSRGHGRTKPLGGRQSRLPGCRARGALVACASAGAWPMTAHSGAAAPWLARPVPAARTGLLSPLLPYDALDVLVYCHLCYVA